MSWKGYETFKVGTSHKEYEKWKKKQKEVKKLPTIEEAVKMCVKKKDDEFILTDKGAFRVSTLKRMNN